MKCLTGHGRDDGGTQIGERCIQADFCAERLKALSDPNRLRIVDLLRHGEMTVGDISQFLDVEVVNLSHHLKILCHVQITQVRRNGRYVCYSLHPDILNNSGRAKKFLDLVTSRQECDLLVTRKQESQIYRKSYLKISN